MPQNARVAASSASPSPSSLPGRRKAARPGNPSEKFKGERWIAGSSQAMTSGEFGNHRAPDSDFKQPKRRLFLSKDRHCEEPEWRRSNLQPHAPIDFHNTEIASSLRSSQ
jgi:hypothetical protein